MKIPTNPPVNRNGIRPLPIHPEMAPKATTAPTAGLPDSRTTSNPNNQGSQMTLSALNPFRPYRLAIADLQVQLARQTTLNITLADEMADLKAQLEVLKATERKTDQLERIAKATEYLKASEAHRREQSGQRHQF